MLDPSIVASIIAAVAGIVAAVVAFLNSRHIRRVEISVDGRLQALVEATARAERAEGQAEGRVIEAAAVAALVVTESVIGTVSTQTQADEVGEAIRVIVEGEAVK